jgi:hypothetical protein
MTYPIARRVVLTVRFDADQISPQLNYKLKRPLQAASDTPPEPEEGEYAGSLYFNPGEELALRVVGAGGENFSGFDIVECCFVSVPQILACGPQVPTVYSKPSMFEGVNGAVLPICLDFQTTNVPQKDGRQLVVQSWKDTVDITKVHGRWELSFYLTVRIRRRDESSELRVFSFDPESEVGNGYIPP